jgi:alcohol dehydrogenase (quinone), cytochrome c subunit
MKHRISLRHFGLSAFALSAVLIAAGVGVAQDAAPPVAETAAPAATSADAAPAEAMPAEAAAPVDPLVEQGKYLALAGNCVSCHTRHGGEPYAGGLPMKTPYLFLGTLYSTNITPDPETGIGKWTEAEFIKAMHTGVAPGGKYLFPAFPYTAFTLVTEDDLKAIYAYLKTLAPVKYTPPANSPVFSLRFGMMFWNALFFKEERFTPDPAQSDEWNRGAYLVEGLGHCGACHTPRNIFMAEKTDQKLSGGALPDLVAEDKYRMWSGVNLTSAKSGLGSWSVDHIAKYLKTGHSPKAGIFGPMNEVVINSLQYLTVEDAKAMAVYLKSLPPMNESPKQTLTEEQKTAGEALYKTHCDECHLASGRGAFLKAPPIAGSAIAQAKDPSSLINVILYGAKVGKGSPTPFGAWEDMKSYADKMTDEEIATLANYVRSNWDNLGGPVSAADVAKQR